MSVAFSVILSCYCLLLIVFLIGWILIRRQSTPAKSTLTQGISVIVAVRDEQENIQNLMNDLALMAYPTDKFEVLIVNDHSTDGTAVAVKDFSRTFPNLKLLELPSGKEGKKQALQMGIEQSAFDIIVTTDADCRFSKNWLKCHSLHFDTEETKMVIGSVKLTNDQSFFSRLQVTEFISLVGTSAAAIGLGHPVMCNGANLAYRKSVFNEVKGYEGNLQIASGDDEFLMRKIFKKYASGIKFLNYYEGVVSSNPQKTMRDFIYQRLRWAGKWKHNSDPWTRILAIFIFVSQLAFVALVAGNIISPNLSLGVVATKLFLEGVFLFWVGRFLERRFDVLAFIALQILYPFYVIVTGALSLTLSYRWKSRNYK